MRNLAAYMFTGLIVSQSVAAIDYVPPPPGPYESTSVISRSDVEEPEQERVYRFPSDDFLRQFGQDSISSAEPVRSPVPVPSKVQPHAVTPPVVTSPEAPIANHFSVPSRVPQTGYSTVVPGNNNPWGTAGTGQPYYSPPPQQQYQHDVWNYQPYSYPGSYPYQQGGYPYPPGYGENNPFSSMPSPWSMMPMQDFFSDKK